LIDTKVRIERELSSNEPDAAIARESVTRQQPEYFIELKKEAFRRYFEDALEKVPLRLYGIYEDPGEVAHG
jgi:hypothetical protein